MKLLLDENIPHAFRHDILGHEVRTADYMGWKGRVNGELLALARDEFDVIITLDKSMENQQNLTEDDVGLMIIRAGTDDINVLRTLIPQILEHLKIIRRGEIVRVFPLK